MFNNTKFLVTPTSGAYLNVTDNASDANVLTINLVTPTPADGSAQTATSGGALVNWSSGGAQIAWTNAAGGNWNTASNWSLGRVPVAGDAVVIAVAAPHRGEAFDACEWLIDELKRTVPIWKKEVYTEGEAWVDDRP